MMANTLNRELVHAQRYFAKQQEYYNCFHGDHDIHSEQHMYVGSDRVAPVCDVGSKPTTNVNNRVR